MFNSKKKAITLSYDDGITQDIRLIEILNKYGIKCTFNLNSGLLGGQRELEREGVYVRHDKIKPQDVKYIYDGHEVAGHSVTHPQLPKLSDEEVIREVEDDRIKLSELCGYEVVGMAYPGGVCDERVANLIKNNTGIKYARTVVSTFDFKPQDNLYLFNPTLYHHANWTQLYQTADRFFACESDKPQVFYLWGHTFEFDIYPERWQEFEQFLKYISGRSDVFYGTNKEVLLAE